MNQSTPMPSTATPGTTPTGAIADGADRLAGRIERNLQDVEQTAADAMQTMTRRVDGLLATSSEAVARASAEAENLAHRGMARAREAVSHARDSAANLRDDTAERVKADPMKALLVAAAAGAASAILVQWLARSRHPR